ncbi:pilus assembly protein TadE [Ornithinimicrobium sp. F0845]|uniref:TadE family type IV pilus minor pilin n=1 Tax=Ornithinimicrobium sp. F0845 TaxID=2926412 RepID=UPI001FF1D6F3|nr:TadE family type IV pilus minor pilin [Ornithinimicrobium sp. F0845]MCK0113134.1 pilus assembly protein TadE [Ornithinimicrobium sp. F0845]
MATAELAIAIPALVAVLALCLSGLGLAVDQIRCVDAARIAVRAAARGEPTEVVQELALQVAPEGASVEVDHSGDRVRVSVSVPARTRFLPGLPKASATVEAVLEPVARMGSP